MKTQKMNLRKRQKLMNLSSNGGRIDNVKEH